MFTIAEVSILNDLNSSVVCKLSCTGCTSTYVGQTGRHLTTGIEEPKKADSPVDLHFQQRRFEGNRADIIWQTVDRWNGKRELYCGCVFPQF